MLEAIRQFPVDVGRNRCMFIHLTLVPYIGHAGELKTKPTQHSVNELRRIGIQPDMLMARSEGGLSLTIGKKTALSGPRPRRAHTTRPQPPQPAGPPPAGWGAGGGWGAGRGGRPPARPCGSRWS